MKNALANHDRIAKVIEDAVVRGSGYAASEAASTIDKEFILIKKSDLPPITEKDSYPHNPWDKKVVKSAGSANYRGMKPELYWDRALDFISVALYAEQEVVKQEERELAGKREEAWKLLHPLEAFWDYESQPPSSQKQIDVVVKLMLQVDELKEAK